MNSLRQLKSVLIAAAVVTAVAALPLPLSAQAVGTIRGTVVETGVRRPLAGVQVLLVGTNRGTTTNERGEYSFTNVPAGRVQIRAGFVGFQTALATQRVTAGEEIRVDFALDPQDIALNALVVTGTAGATQRRKLGNSVVTLDAAEVTEKTNVADVSEILQSRTPGVQILSNAGTPGAAPDIRVRGAGSLSAVSPIIYVDGVRYSDESLGNFGASGAGLTAFSTQVTSALSFINPEDIESIEVIKGPAAATLYGAEAAAGVIQIITKKGARGQQNTRWSAKYELGQNEFVADIPDNFTTCTPQLIALRDPSNPTEPLFPGCANVAPFTVLRESSPILRDPFGLRDGDVQRLNVSVRGGGNGFSYFVAGDMDDEEGVFFNSFNTRRSFRGNFTATASDRLDFQVTTNYTRNHLRLPIGDESAQGLLLGSVRGTVGRIPRAPGVFPGYAFSVDGARANNYNNQTRSDRTTLGGTVNYRPWEWFRNRLTLGLDLTNSQATILSPPGSTDAEFAGTPEGLSALRMPRNRYYTVDYVGNVEVPVNRWLESTTSFGTQFIAKRYDALFGSGTGLGSPSITTIQNAAFTTGANAVTENNSIGYYVQQQFGFNDRLFLVGALRADDNSSFGRNFDVIVYPKASMSWVLSEEPRLEALFDGIQATQFKVRAAYGQAGRAPDPYSADQTYTVGKVTLPAGTGVTTGSGIVTNRFGNPDLKPERGEEVEAGFEGSFLGDRLGVDFTFYSKNTDDLLQFRAVAPSTGFISSQLTNLGSIHNSGVELLLNARPVELNRFSWESRLNFAANDNELTKINDADQQSIAANFQAYFPGLQVHRVGYPLASFFAPVAIPDSFAVISGVTFPVLDTAQFIGTPTPTREIGWGNTFTVYGVRLFAQLDYKGGHKVFNYKEYNRCRFAGNCERVNDVDFVRARNPRTAADSAFAQSPAGTGLVRGTSLFAGRAVLNGRVVSFPTPYIEDGDFLKLRDLSVTLGIPSRLLGYTPATGADLTLAAHNVATLWTKYSGLDPEVNTYGNRSFVRVDAYAAPLNRRITAAINFTF